MARTVRVKVGNQPDSPVKTMSEESANRLVGLNPKEYRILEAPKVDVINLPKLEATVDAQKKSVIVAEAEKVDLPTNGVNPNQFANEEKRKPGRPKANP